MSMKTAKKISITLVLMLLFGVFTLQGAYACTEVNLENVELLNTSTSENIVIMTIPGTTVTRYTIRKKIYGEPYIGWREVTQTRTITVYGETMDELNMQIGLAVDGAFDFKVGTTTKTTTGYKADVTITTVDNYRVEYTPWSEYDITNETIRDDATGSSYTYELGRVFIRSGLDWRYV